MNESNTKTTCRLAIQVEVGTTVKGRTSYRTINIRDLRADITQEELLLLLQVIAPMLAHPISGARLVTQEVKTILAPQANAAKEQMETVVEPVKEAVAVASAPAQELPRSISVGDLAELLPQEMTGEVAQETKPARNIFSNLQMKGFLPKQKSSNKKKNK